MYAAPVDAIENPSVNNRARSGDDPGTSRTSASQPTGVLELSDMPRDQSTPSENRDPRLVQPVRVTQHLRDRMQEEREAHQDERAPRVEPGPPDPGARRIDVVPRRRASHEQCSRS